MNVLAAMLSLLMVVDAQADALRAIVRASKRLPLEATEIKPAPPRDGWAMGMVSWVAADRGGLIYILQRGDKADPIVVMRPDGTVVRSWGAGLYVMPHAIRIDSRGNVWTTDAASSKVIEFTSEGKQLMEIAVGGQPSPCRNNFCGTTDIDHGSPTVVKMPSAPTMRSIAAAAFGMAAFDLSASIAVRMGWRSSP